MHNMPTIGLRSLLAFLGSFASTIVLAVLWNVLGFAPPATQVGYELSEYFTPITWGFVASYTAIAFLLGWATQQVWPVALGMILTLPIASAIEIARDRTSHNLLPFEILLYWLPGFALAFGAAYTGDVVRRRVRKPPTN